MTIFAQSDVTASTNVLVWTASAAATVNILAANRTANTIGVSIALVKAGNSPPANPTVGSAWIVAGNQLDGNQMLEKGGLPIDTGDMVYLYASGAGISATVTGILI